MFLVLSHPVCGPLFQVPRETNIEEIGAAVTNIYECESGFGIGRHLIFLRHLIKKKQTLHCLEKDIGRNIDKVYSAKDLRKN